MDALIKKAFSKKVKAASGADGVLLGRLTDLAELFPSQKANSLRMLAGLSVKAKKGDRPQFLLNVSIGHCREFSTANELHPFYNKMIEAESEKDFNEFMANGGHSLIVTAGEKPRTVIAAASFIGRRDGIYVASFAVSHGKHMNSCPVPQKALANFREDQEKHKTSLKEGNFQGFGLGSFLISVLSSITSFLCVDEAAIYLKAYYQKKQYYISRGFETIDLISPSLHEALPAFYRRTDADTVLMILMVRRSEEAAAAQAIVELNSPAVAKARPNEPNSNDEDDDVPDQDNDDPMSDEVREIIANGDGDKKPEAVDRSNEDPSIPELNKNAPSSPSKSSKRKKNARKKKAQAKAASTSKAKRDSASIMESEKDVGIALAKKLDAKKRKKNNASRGLGQAAIAVEVAISEDEDDDEDDDDEDDDISPPIPEHVPRSETLSHDWWKPQEKAYKKFMAEAPVTSHQLSQKELCAEYEAPPLKVSTRQKVLKVALDFKEDTNFMKASRLAAKYNVDFSDQEYLDLAAVSDLDRPIEIHHKDYNKALQEVPVHVSGYLISDTSTLEKLLPDKRKQKKMNPAVRIINVSVPWLLSTTRPEVAKMIDDELHGTKVQAISGPTDGADAFSLSYGKFERVDKYVPLPQGHVYAAFAPIAPPTVPWSRPRKKENATKQATRKSDRSLAEFPDVYYDENGRATALLHQHMKLEARTRKIPFMAPPPHDQTQVVKLKWIPSPGTSQEGLWHGVYATQLGVGKSHTILQECGLLTDWVDSTFAAPFRKECKDVASGKEGARNPKQFLFIPAGDAHDTVSDPPPASELRLEARTRYLQGDKDTCLRDSLASALAAMGLDAEAKIVATDSDLVGRSLDLVSTASQSVKIHCASVNLVMKRIHGCSISAIAQLDSAWPIILLFQTSDGCYGSHAATTWNGMIFDANFPNPLRWSQKSLDWCSGPGSLCIGFNRAYRICPRNYEELPPDSTSLTEGTWLLPREGGISGWIWRTPTSKLKEYIVRYPSGATESMSKESVEAVCAVRSKVGFTTF